ncbi:MAG: lipid II flippase MurJ, partial [Candidatus Paceibacterota bacterium]
MVKRIITFFSRDVSGVHEAAYLLGFFAILSQIIAFFRDRLLASNFGAGQTLDLYYAAFRIPDFIFVAVASIVSFSVLVPFLVDALGKSKEEGNRFVNNVFSFFALLMLITSVIAFFLIPYLAPIVFPGIKDSALPLFIHMTRILLLSPIILGISNFLASITQVYKKFYIYALSPVLYNIGIMFGIIVLYPIFGLSGLAWGVVAGAILHVAPQVALVIKLRLLPRLNFRIIWLDIWNIVRLSIPRTITLGVAQFATLALVGYASLMHEGSISVFNFSLNVQGVPLAIIGASYATAAFPTLSRLFSTGQRDKMSAYIVNASKHIIFWSLPLSVLFIVLRAQVVRTILGAGAFTWTATRLTAATLAILALCVAAQSLVLLFVRAHYAIGNTFKPLIAGIVGGLSSIGFAFLFVYIWNVVPTFHYFIESLFRVEDIPGTEVLMLALGYSLGMIINCVILWVQFHREFVGFSKALFSTLFESLGASVIMGSVTYVALNFFNKIFSLDTLVGVFLQGLCAGVVGIIVGVGIFYLLKNEELAQIWKTLHGKIWK